MSRLISLLGFASALIVALPAAAEPEAAPNPGSAAVAPKPDAARKRAMVISAFTLSGVSLTSAVAGTLLLLFPKTQPDNLGASTNHYATTHQAGGALVGLGALSLAVAVPLFVVGYGKSGEDPVGDTGPKNASQPKLTVSLGGVSGTF